jgi:hypothetical protein
MYCGVRLGIYSAWIQEQWLVIGIKPIAKGI